MFHDVSSVDRNDEIDRTGETDDVGSTGEIDRIGEVDDLTFAMLKPPDVINCQMIYTQYGSCWF